MASTTFNVLYFDVLTVQGCYDAMLRCGFPSAASTYLRLQLPRIVSQFQYFDGNGEWLDFESLITEQGEQDALAYYLQTAKSWNFNQ